MNLTKKAILLSYISTASLSAAIITPALPTIEKSFSLPLGGVEWLVTIFLLGYMFGQLIYGPLSNRFGRLPTIRTGFLINLLGTLLSLLAAYSESFIGLLWARLFTSLGAAAGLCCTFTLIYELVSEEQAKKMLSYSVLSFTLAIGLSIFIGGFITQYFSWKALFFVLFIHAIFLFVSTWLFHETQQEKIPIHPKIIVKGYFELLKNKKLVIYSLIFGVSAIFSYCYSTAAPMIAKQFLQLNAAEYGTWNTLTMIGMTLGSLTAAQLIKKLPIDKFLNITLFLLGGIFVSFLIQRVISSKNPIWFFTTATGSYLFTSWIFPSASFLALQNSKDRASASGVMNFISMGTSVTSVALMGYLPFSSFTALLFILLGSLTLTIVGKFFLQKAGS